MKFFLIVFYLLAFSFHGYSQRDPPIHSGEICKAGNDLLDSGDYKNALAMFEKIDRNDSNYVKSLYGRALSLQGDSQYNKAIQFCLEALKQNEQTELYPAIYNSYGNLLDNIGDMEKCQLVFNEAIKKYPAYSKLYFNKGIALFYKQRYAESESVFKECLLINPYEFSAHYYLGLAAINQGKIIPAFLSFTGYLLVNPGGKYEKKCVNILAAMAKGTDEIMNFKNQRTSEGDENFALTEEILLSKIALEKEYKVNVSLDDPIFRQIQVVCEKLEYKPDDPDFWMQFYVPFYKKMFVENQFEPFIFWSFGSVELKEIQDYNKKNKKVVEHFVNGTAEYFNLIRATRELDLKKRAEQKIIYSYSESGLEGYGEVSSDNKNAVGKWILLYSDGNIMGKGSFAGSKKEGEWTYYFFSGKLKAIENMHNGQQDGKQLYYSEKGLLTYDQAYMNGKKNGVETVYYSNGNISAIGSYKDDKLEGEYKVFYDGNQLKSVSQYANNLLTGTFTNYFENGQIKNTGSYQNGSLNGNYKEFHENGQIAAEGTYKNDQTEGGWKYFYDNGKLKSKTNFINGKQEGISEEYYEDGPMSDTYTFRKGVLNGETVSYDIDQKVYGRFQFSDGVLQSARYFDKTGKLLSSSERKNNELHLTAYRADGTKSFQKTINEKGEVTGTQTDYYSSGKISRISEYKNGEKNGLQTEYFLNGKKKNEIFFKEGKTDGYTVNYYSNGKIQNEGWMLDDQYAGYWNYYDESGTLTNRDYYSEGVLSGYRTEYYSNSSVAFEKKFYKGLLEELKQFDSTGKLLVYDSFPRFSGKCLLVYPDGKKMQEYNIVNGNIEGYLYDYYFDGSLNISRYYKGGLLDSNYTQYEFDHVINVEGQYKAGKKSGLWKFYDLKGKLESTQNFSDGELNGWMLIYLGDQVTGKIPYRHGNRHGEETYTDPEGDLMFNIRLNDGKITEYFYLDKEGKPVTPIQGSQGKLNLKTYFQNGQVSRECEYVDDRLNGIDRLYYKNGKLRSEQHFEYGDFEGQVSEYYSNGNPREINNYHNDQLQGRSLRYNEQGKMIREYNFNNGRLHGETKIYDDNGSLLETLYYYDGTLLSVKK